MMHAPVIVIPCSSKAAYLKRYAQPDKGWTDEDETRWPVPFWHIDTGMAALLILQTVTDAGLGACYFGVPPDRRAGSARRSASPNLRPDRRDHHRPPHATDGRPGSPSTRPRKAQEDVVHQGAGASGTPPSPSAVRRPVNAPRGSQVSDPR